MASSSRLSSLRQLPSILRSTSPRPTCPSCSLALPAQAVQAGPVVTRRGNAFGSRGRGKGMKLSREFAVSSPAGILGPGRGTQAKGKGQAGSSGTKSKKLSAADSLLLTQFQAEFPPRARLDPLRVVQVCYPLVFRQHLREHLQPFLQPIATCMSTLLRSTTPAALPTNVGGATTSVALASSPAGGSSSSELTPEDRRRALVLLGHCYFRTASLSHLITPATRSLAHTYASCLIREALLLPDDADKEALLKQLETGLFRPAQTSGASTVIPADIVAAWAVLRAEAGMQEELPRYPFVWPDEGDVMAAVERMVAAARSEGGGKREAGEPVDARSYAADVQLLMAANGVETSWLPRDLPALKAELAGIRAREDWPRLVSLWERFRNAITRKPTAGTSPASEILDPAPETRNLALGHFLLALFRSAAPGAAPAPPIVLTYAKELLALCPRPLPRSIAHTLLAVRARSDDMSDSPGPGQEVTPLDEVGVSVGGVDALENLRAAWAATGERDLKMYMIYMEGLGLFGDLTGLRRTWNELVEDERCKELYLQEESKEDGSVVFPPTRALNQMISSTLIIAKEGPPIALELFEQASREDSSIPCNIITINTILRHHARQANIPAMNALFVLAERLRLVPDIITYTTLVQGVLRAGRMDLAKAALESMQNQGVQPNERMCSMLVADLAKDGSRMGLQHAEELLELMRKNGFRTNEVTWTSLIAGYFRGGWDQDAWDAVSRMKALGLRLNRVSYNILFRQVGEVERREGMLMSIWRRMLAEGVRPNSDSYILMLSPLVRGQAWDSAEAVVAEMRRQLFKPQEGRLRRCVDMVESRR
ncbi:hypothetical protein IAT38_005274 [Cryptococcus sp. DSM 104549]